MLDLLNDFAVEINVGMRAPLNHRMNSASYVYGYTWVQKGTKVLKAIWMPSRNRTGGNPVASLGICYGTSGGNPDFNNLYTNTVTITADYVGYRFPTSGDINVTLVDGVRYGLWVKNVSGTPTSTYWWFFPELMFAGTKDDCTFTESMDLGVTWTACEFGQIPFVLEYTDGSRFGPTAITNQATSTLGGAAIYSSASYNGITGLRFNPEWPCAIQSATFYPQRRASGDCGVLACSVWNGINKVVQSSDTHVTPWQGSNNYVTYEVGAAVQTFGFGGQAIVYPGDDIVIGCHQRDGIAGDGTNHYLLRSFDANVAGFPMPNANGDGTVPMRLRGVYSTSKVLSGWTPASANTAQVPCCKIRLVPIMTRGQF